MQKKKVRKEEKVRKKRGSGEAPAGASITRGSHRTLQRQLITDHQWRRQYFVEGDFIEHILG